MKKGIQSWHHLAISLSKMTHILMIMVSPLLIRSLIWETYIEGAVRPESPGRLVDTISTTNEEDKVADAAISKRFRRTTMHSRRVNPKVSEIEESSNLNELEEQSDVSEDEISNGTILLPLLLIVSGRRRIITDGESCETFSKSLDQLQRMRVPLTSQWYVLHEHATIYQISGHFTK